MVSEFRQPAIGDHVLVPWGMDEVEGEVIEIYHTGLGPRARVQLTDDPHGSVVTVPLDSLLPQEKRPSIRSPIDGRRYEQLVAEAVRRAVAETHLHSTVTKPRDWGADLELRYGKRRVLVQVKFFTGDAYVSTDSVVTAAGLSDNWTSVLLVANVPLARSAAKRLDELRKHGTRMGFVKWISSEQDKDMQAALTRLAIS